MYKIINNWFIHTSSSFLLIISYLDFLIQISLSLWGVNATSLEIYHFLLLRWYIIFILLWLNRWPYVFRFCIGFTFLIHFRCNCELVVLKTGVRRLFSFGRYSIWRFCLRLLTVYRTFLFKLFRYSIRYLRYIFWTRGGWRYFSVLGHLCDSLIGHTQMWVKQFIVWVIYHNWFQVKTKLIIVCLIFWAIHLYLIC